MLSLLDEGPIREDVVDDPDHRRSRDPGREADRPASLDDLGLHDELLGLDVGDVVDAGEVGVVVDLALRSQVLGVRAVPVEMVGGDVEHRRGDGGDRSLPVQLEAGQLDREDVIGLRVQHRLEDRRADVAGRRRAQPRRPQDRGEHVDGRRLAVRAGDREPRSRALERAHPPRQLDLAPDRYPAGVAAAA